MRKPQGYACITDPDGVREADTFTCAHCQRITHVKAGAKPEDLGGLCKQCMGLICSRCVGNGCAPFLKSIEKAEARDAMFRAMGVI